MFLGSKYQTSGGVNGRLGFPQILFSVCMKRSHRVENLWKLMRSVQMKLAPFGVFWPIFRGELAVSFRGRVIQNNCLAFDLREISSVTMTSPLWMAHKSTTTTFMAWDLRLAEVYNVLPASVRCYWTVKAILAGKHVLSETPSASRQWSAFMNLTDEW